MILKILTKFIKGNQKITPPLSEQFSNNHPQLYPHTFSIFSLQKWIYIYPHLYISPYTPVLVMYLRIAYVNRVIVTPPQALIVANAFDPWETESHGLVYITTPVAANQHLCNIYVNRVIVTPHPQALIVAITFDPWETK